MAINVKYGQRFIFSESLRPHLHSTHYRALLGTEIEIMQTLVDDTECVSIPFRCIVEGNPFYGMSLSISPHSFLKLIPVNNCSNRQAIIFLKRD